MTHNNRAHFQQGFTLLEVMLVILLMGLTASVVTLTMGNSGPKEKLTESAKQFIASVEILLNESVLNGSLFGIIVEDNSYQFVKRKDQKWQAIENDRMLTKREISDGQLTVTIEGLPLTQEDEEDTSLFEEPFKEAEVGFTQDEKPLPEPQIIIFPSGELTEFELDFTTKEDGKTIMVSVVGEAIGRLNLGKPNED